MKRKKNLMDTLFAGLLETTGETGLSKRTSKRKKEATKA